jgi:hypothetical protein
MGAPTPTSAPTPFPEGDPRNAKYFETVAQLEHQLNNGLAGDQQDLVAAKAAYDYSTGQLDRQLPLTLRGTRDTANSQGLLESGQLAQRTGTVESRYAAQRGQMTSRFQQEENRVHQAESSANENFNLGRSRAAQNAREEAKAQLEKEAPNDQVPAAAPPGAPVVVRSYRQPNSSTPQARTVRRQAASRAVGRWPARRVW